MQYVGRLYSKNTRLSVTILNNDVIDQYYVVLRVVKKGDKTDLSYLKEIRK